MLFRPVRRALADPAAPLRDIPVEIVIDCGMVGPVDLGVWWSSGSDLVEPSVLWCRGLPSPDGFPALLVGNWDGFGWADGALGEVG